MRARAVNVRAHTILKVSISFFAPFIFKSADFYEIIRVKGAEKQTVSLRNEPEKQAVSPHHWLEK